MDDDTDVLRMEDDYYSFLNLSKTATNDEINNAYRRFSRMYHPDKHVDPEQKKKAEILFNKTKKAYEVLSDAHQRAIYDSLGTRGLETEGWEIVQRTKTPQEIREEYERLAREREERRLQQSTNPKGSISVAINATDLFNRYKDEYDLIDEGVLPVIEVSGMTINQSIEAPITLRDTVTLSGNISTQNGTGSGAINVASRRITSERGWAEVEVGAGNGPMFTFRGFRTLTRALCVSGGAIMQFTERGIKPSLVSTFACQFDGQSVGYLTYRCSGISSSAMSTTYVCNTEKYHASVSLQFGIPHSFISATYTRKMLQAELKLRISVKAGTFGAVAEYGAEKKVSQHSTISATVSFGVPSGVMLKIRITRATQSFIFPIHLCEEIIPAPIFYATMVPIATWLTVKRFMIDPINKEKERREKERTLETNRKRIFEMQKEARAALDLMQETYVRIKSEEEKKKGLIINKAYYGKMSESLRDQLLSTNEIENDASPLHIDPIPLELFEVTIQLQCLIKDSKLVLQESSKAQLPGFFDPCVGEEKFLIIHYQFLHHQYCCCISDLESLRLPKQTHRISRA